jgi:hypothetical protein
MTANPHLDATVVETRRLDLLRRIADSGGAISPVAEPQAKHGYQYVAPVADVANDLAALARQNYLEARFFDKVSLCPKCDACHLNVREICPSCRSAHLASEGLFHHFRCGLCRDTAGVHARGGRGISVPEVQPHHASSWDRI